MLAAVGLVLIGGAAWYLFPNYTGGVFARDLLLIPTSALGPQVIAGFFAPRASYLLGLVVGVVQTATTTVLLSAFPTQLGLPATTGAQAGPFLVSLLIQGVPLSVIFASAAAWYRRFLSLSSPKRVAAGRGTQSRGPAKPAASRRAGR